MTNICFSSGNETCSDPLMTNDCNFVAIHYFREAGTYTYLVVIENEISHEILPLAINVYNGKWHQRK